MLRPITVYDAKKQKHVEVGKIGERTFYKKVNRVKHYLRIMQGYAIDEQAVRKLLEMNIDKVVVQEDTGVQFSISLAGFMEHGINFNLGHGPQVVCPERYWRKVDPKQLELL